MSHRQIIIIAGLILVTISIVVAANIATPSFVSTEATADSERTALATSPYQSSLEQIVTNFAQQYADTTGLFVIDISNDAQASYNESRQFISTSLYKLFVAYAVLDLVDTAELRLDDTLQETGTTIEYCLDVMITVSDNTCAVALGKYVGWQAIDERLQSEGYMNTILNNYDADGALITDKLTTPRDVATLLKRLHEGMLLSDESTERFIALLKQQTLNYALPTGLDPDISFAHKTGVLSEVSHDAGFLTYQGRTLVVVMMTDGWTAAYSESPDRFAEFGRAISTYMKTTLGEL